MTMSILDKCAHGKKWDEDCEHCQYAWDKGTVESFGPMVSQARKRMAEYEQKQMAATLPPNADVTGAAPNGKETTR